LLEEPKEPSQVPRQRFVVETKYWPGGQTRQRLLYKEVPEGQERQVGGFVLPRSIEQATLGVEQYEAKKELF